MCSQDRTLSYDTERLGPPSFCRTIPRKRKSRLSWEPVIPLNRTSIFKDIQKINSKQITDSQVMVVSCRSQAIRDDSDQA